MPVSVQFAETAKILNKHLKLYFSFLGISSVFRSKDTRLPTGVTFGKLTASHAELVFKHWTSSRRTSDKDYWLRYFRASFEHLPTICVFNKDGRPIAWSGNYLEGCAGFGYADPEYRGYELGTITLFLNIQERQKRGMDFVGYVSSNNHKVKELLARYFVVPNGSMQFVHYRGNGNPEIVSKL